MKKNNEKTLSKCKIIKMIISDVDGVLTDGGMYYSEKGEIMKKFNTKDGMAVEIANQNKIKIILMTKENSKIVKTRAAKIKTAACYIGIKQKELELEKILKKFNIKSKEIAYIGDDINDKEIMKKVGFTVSPFDGITEIKKIADYTAKHKGGEGVLREVVELILSVKKTN